jgi:hypothetical protein
MKDAISIVLTKDSFAFSGARDNGTSVLFFGDDADVGRWCFSFEVRADLTGFGSVARKPWRN